MQLIRNYHKSNGSLYEEYHVDSNFVKQGRLRRWYNSGQLSLDSGYKNGTLNGLYRSWNENGIPYESCEYKNGSVSGLHEWWFDIGNRQSITTRKNSRVHGTRIQFKL